MIGKVKLTQEQADALKDYLADCKGDISEAIDEHSDVYCDPDDGWVGDHKALNKIAPSDLARALLIGYEVEETFEVGDWVVYKDRIIEIVAVEYAKMLNKNTGDSQSRHATTKEIKAELERRVWESIGREVGGFREGDVGIFKNEYVDHVDALGVFYKDGVLTGFYPAESFIEFGGAEE